MHVIVEGINMHSIVHVASPSEKTRGCKVRNSLQMFGLRFVIEL